MFINVPILEGENCDFAKRNCTLTYGFDESTMYCAGDMKVFPH